MVEVQEKTPVEHMCFEVKNIIFKIPELCYSEL